MEEETMKRIRYLGVLLSAFCLLPSAVQAQTNVSMGPGQGMPVTQGQPARTTGTISSATSTVSVAVSGYAVATVTVNGTYSGVTINFNFSDDGGTTWYSELCGRTDTALQEASEALPANQTRAWDCGVYAASNFQVAASAWTSGTANIGITLSAAGIEPAQTVSLSGAVPSGSNTIGNVGLNPGSNTVGAVNQAGKWVIYGPNLDGSENATITKPLPGPLPPGQNMIGQVTGAGQPGAPETHPMTVQGIPNGTPVQVQGISGATPVPVNMNQINGSPLPTWGGLPIIGVIVVQNTDPYTMTVRDTVTNQPPPTAPAGVVNAANLALSPSSNPLLWKSQMQGYCFRNLIPGCF
jgi:hypothetical protein